MTNIRILLSTIDNEQQAEEIARTLVGERLAACVNILPKLTSIYRWQGKIETAPELLLIIKTHADKVPAMTRRLSILHPYEVPEIICLPVVSGDEPYLDWIRSETGSEE